MGWRLWQVEYGQIALGEAVGIQIVWDKILNAQDEADMSIVAEDGTRARLRLVAGDERFEVARVPLDQLVPRLHYPPADPPDAFDAWLDPEPVRGKGLTQAQSRIDQYAY